MGGLEDPDRIARLGGVGREHERFQSRSLDGHSPQPSEQLRRGGERDALGRLEPQQLRAVPDRVALDDLAEEAALAASGVASDDGRHGGAGAGSPEQALEAFQLGLSPNERSRHVQARA
jgi:hypothetical protein